MTRNVIIIALWIVLGLALTGHAQVNIEEQRLGRKDAGLAGTIGVTLKLERGNSDLTEIDLNPRAVFRTGRHLVFSLNKLSFVDAAEGSIVNEGFSHLRYNYTVTSRVIAEAFGQIQYNHAQDLARRTLIGGGLRFPIVTRPDFGLAIGVSGMYEYEKLRSGPVAETPRNSDYASFRFVRADLLRVTNTIYVQPAFDDIGDIRVLNDLEIDFALSKWLALTTSGSYRYDSQPPAGIKQYDLSLEHGLKVLF